jgi:hypothetical protein
MDKKEHIILLLKKAGEEFQQIAQWKENRGTVSWASNVFEHTAKAEILIQICEVLDCGSTGGFGKNQLRGLSLFGRWNWLRQKYSPELKTTIGGWDLLKLFVEE